MGSVTYRPFFCFSFDRPKSGRHNFGSSSRTLTTCKEFRSPFPVRHSKGKNRLRPLVPRATKATDETHRGSKGSLPVFRRGFTPFFESLFGHPHTVPSGGHGRLRAALDFRRALQRVRPEFAVYERAWPLCKPKNHSKHMALTGSPMDFAVTADIVNPSSGIGEIRTCASSQKKGQQG